jgi:phosphatidate cytidylyltransferase|tara:strand:- start:177 stop:839 length:663 start_codon:yes stop_codon:yes gene_type:complete
MKNEIKLRVVTSMLLLIAFFLMLTSNYILVTALLLLFIFSFLEFSSLIQKIFIKKKFLQIFSNSLFFFYILLFLVIFFILLQIEGTRFLLIFIIFSCVSSDIGGILFGRIFKGPKLTRLSPNKTISGSLGSFILSLISCYLFIFFTQIPVLNKIFILALITSFGCQVGDIFFSYLKRRANVKDTGNVLPGHGGLLDRFDSFLFGIPLGLISSVVLFSLSI